MSTQDITRVTVEALGVTHDLARDPNSSNFTGVIGLPAGMQTLTARAFVGDQIVGVSSPTPVDIQTGGVSQVSIFIVDTSTGSQPGFSPIFESLTHPMSVAAGQPAMFAALAVSPTNDPVSYAWTSSCPDSTFSDPQSPMTTWSDPTPGSCSIVVTATADGVSNVDGFTIEVFDGAAQGAANVSAAFVPAPSIDLSLQTIGCDVTPSSPDASCGVVQLPKTVEVFAQAAFFGTPSSLVVTDDCGGQFDVLNSGAATFHANWTPPASGGVCIMTGRAVDQTGAIGILSAAVLVVPAPAAGSRH